MPILHSGFSAGLGPTRIALAFALTLLGGCERLAADPPAPPPPALLETAPIALAQLCAEPLRAWAVLGEGGSTLAISRGRCLGRVEHPQDGPLWQLVAQLQPVDAAQPSWELHTWVDDQGRPRRGEFRTPELVTRFAWGQDGVLRVRRLGDQLALADAGGLWITPSHGLYLREVMLRLGVGVTAAGIRQRGFVPELDTITELELELVRLEGDHAQARAGPNTLALEGAAAGLGALQINLVLGGDALIYRSYTPAGDERLAPFLPAIPRPRYRAGEDLSMVPLTIPGLPGGAPTLAGELVLGDAHDHVQPRPAILFLAGAGAQDRYGIVPHSAVDMGSHELHDALARAGFVVLRFDDRGVGASEIGDDPTPGFMTLVDDGRRALATLAARPEVDPKRIVVIGHGEGALLASILAGEGVRVHGRKQSLAGLVLLAAPARNLRELIYDEIRASMAGQRDAAIRTVVQRAQQVHDAALADDDLPASSEGARRWMVEAFAEDPLARLAKVRAPILAVQGGKDFQVSPERDFALIREWIERQAAKGSEAELFPGLDHLLKPEPGVSTPGHYADLRRRVDPALIDRVREWALAVTR